MILRHLAPGILWLAEWVRMIEAVAVLTALVMSGPLFVVGLVLGYSEKK
jgi:hypothetical protein